MRQFSTGATRDNDENKLHFKGFISPRALRAYAAYMERHRVQADGSLRDPDNWKKGIPTDAYEDSFIRHAMEFHWHIEEGNTGQAMDTACAIWFNIQGWMHEMLRTDPVDISAEDLQP